MPGAMGVGYEGSKVTSVTAGGLTDRGGVRVGMRIRRIEGRAMPDDSCAIKASIKQVGPFS